MKNSYSTRKAKLTDAPQIVPLMYQLKIPQDEATVTKAIAEQISNNNYRIFIAEQNSQLVGLVSLYIFSSYLVPIKKCHIEVLVIDKDYRNKGIGKNLLHEAEKFALKNNCELIELISANWRKAEGVHDFYINEGYINQGEKGIAYFYKSYKKLWSKDPI